MRTTRSRNGTASPPDASWTGSRNSACGALSASSSGITSMHARTEHVKLRVPPSFRADPSMTFLPAASGPVPDVRVALPGPVGDMALYSILENVIRNAAKHGSKDRGTAEDRKALIVNLLIADGEVTDDDRTVTLSDNLSDPS